jgi:flagellar motor switch protein FliG
MQQLLKDVANEDLKLAMKTCSDELREKIFRNMSQRAAEMLREELEFMGPVRVTDVERAQQKITQIAKRLEAEGKIVIGGKGDSAVV